MTQIYLSPGDSIRDVYYKADYVLRALTKYLDSNFLHINISKSKFIHFKTPKSNEVNMNLNLYNKPLQHVKSIKFLGVHIDEKLNWKLHIDKVSKKLSKISGVLYMIGRSIPKNLMPNVYNALVTSHLYYCIPVWGGNSSQLEPLFTAQKKSLRSLFRLKRARKHHDNWIYGHTKKHFNANKLFISS